MAAAKSHRDLRVYQLAFESATKIHEITKSFPAEEKYSLTDQIRRSSRSVWPDFTLHFKYITPALHKELEDHYDHINSQLTIMMSEPNKWTPHSNN